MPLHAIDVVCTDPAQPARDRAAAAVALAIIEEQIPLAELIRRTVHEQIRVLQVQKLLTAAAVQAALARHYLSPADLARHPRSRCQRLRRHASALPVVHHYQHERWRGKGFRIIAVRHGTTSMYTNEKTGKLLHETHATSTKTRRCRWRRWHR